jgi:Protein kinase domain/FHA domain
MSVSYVLRGFEGPVKGMNLVLVPGLRLVIGRSAEANLAVDDAELSRQHCEVQLRGGQLAVRDLGSRNGVYVNGQRTRQATLAAGDRLIVGSNAFKVAPGDEQPDVSAAPRQRRTRDLILSSDAGGAPPERALAASCAWCMRLAPAPAVAGKHAVCDGCTQAMAIPRDAFSQDYELEGFLGWGALGEVYRARSKGSGELLALKVVRAADHLDPLAVERLLRGVRLTTDLAHPALVPVQEVKTSQGQLLIVSPLIEGEDLGRRLRREQRQGIPFVLALAEAVAGALAHLHAHELVHRDVKPSNILVGREGFFLTDYALAKSLDEHANQVTFTATEERVGSFHFYLPPELAQDHRAAGPRTDLYSLGACLFHALMGRPPIDSTHLGQYLEAIASLEPVQLGALAGAPPPHVARIVEHALQPDPEQRTASAEEMLEEIAEARRFLGYTAE